MRIYSVFGNPIIHSKSPFLHNYVFNALKIDARYVRFHLKSSKNFRDIFFNYGFNGANITLPFKEELIKFCDDLNPLAEKVNAINTIVKKDNKLIGYNTDAMGFFKNIENENIKNALIIGAGGSAKAIAFILRENNIETTIINRSPEKLEFFKKHNFFSLSTNNFNISNYDLIINATSSSINNELPLEKNTLIKLFYNAKLAFDLMYGKKCEFLELAKKCNIKSIDGSKMLLYQAIEASSIFLEMPYNEISYIMQKAYKIINN
ncbi:shikimate dehydrogenase [Helicobacter sp. MIT 14-3879]|uniref:shikimate dehydrogenase n=1 Tax=Helicobacter sp. MIT 14-3879 TaxID=2040649 RepID=UPI000E1ECAB9|nr:shikimate dehydrogenase [Helicobacter sp. MIT 14-3879]RDU65603.1 shikimate dehydrogenase [Helicobacter sp. MIT 14-3879]